MSSSPKKNLFELIDEALRKQGTVKEIAISDLQSNSALKKASGEPYSESTFKTAIKKLNAANSLSINIDPAGKFVNPFFNEPSTTSSVNVDPITTLPPISATVKNINEIISEYRTEINNTTDWPAKIDINELMEDYSAIIDASLKPELKTKFIENLKDLYEENGNQLQLRLTINKNDYEKLTNNAKLLFTPLYFNSEFSTYSEERFINNSALKDRAESSDLETLTDSLLKFNGAKASDVGLSIAGEENNHIPGLISNTYKIVSKEKFDKALKEIKEKVSKNINVLSENNWLDKPDLKVIIDTLTNFYNITDDDKKQIVKDAIVEKVKQYYEIKPEGLELKFKIDEKSFNELSNSGKAGFTQVTTPTYVLANGVQDLKDYINNASLKEKARFTDKASIAEEVIKSLDHYKIAKENLSIPGFMEKNEAVPEAINRIYGEIEQEVIDEIIGNVSDDMKNPLFKWPRTIHLENYVNVNAEDKILEKLNERVKAGKLSEVNARALKQSIRQNLNAGQSVTEILDSTRINVPVNMPKLREAIVSKLEPYYNMVKTPDGDYLNLKLTINKKVFDELKLSETNKLLVGNDGYEIDRYIEYRGNWINREAVVARSSNVDKLTLIQEILAERAKGWTSGKWDNKGFEKLIEQTYVKDLTVKGYFLPPFLFEKAEDSKFIDYLLNNKDFFNDLRSVFSTQAKGEISMPRGEPVEDKTGIIEEINAMTLVYDSYISYDKEAVLKIKDEGSRKAREADILNVQSSIKRNLQKSLNDFFFKHKLGGNEKVIELLDRQFEVGQYKKPEVKRQPNNHLETMFELIYQQSGYSVLNLKNWIEQGGFNDNSICFRNGIEINFGKEGVDCIKAFEKVANYASIEELFVTQKNELMVKPEYLAKVNKVLIQAFNYYCINHSLTGFVRADSSLELLLKSIDNENVLSSITRQIILDLNSGSLMDNKKFAYTDLTGKEAIFDTEKYGISLNEIVNQLVGYANIKDKVKANKKGLEVERSYDKLLKEVVFQAFDYSTKHDKKLEGFNYESKIPKRDWNGLAEMVRSYKSAADSFDEFDVKLGNVLFNRKAGAVSRRLDKIANYNKSFDSMLDKSYNALARKLTSKTSDLTNEMEIINARLTNLEAENARFDAEYQQFRNIDDLVAESGI